MRTCLILRYFAGYSLQEIATHTGRPLGTVKVHVFRGLRRLRATLRLEDE